MNTKWSTRFELKPGKWIFVPTPEMIAVGKEIKSAIEKRWSPPSYFYHLRRGGHVAALRAHLGNAAFLRLDIQDFFGSIGRSRVARCLKSRFGYETAREWAHVSTVRDPSGAAGSIIPFGFVQSPIVASLCLAESARESVEQFAEAQEHQRSVCWTTLSCRPKILVNWATSCWPG
jgi:hypothetical protein